MLIPGIGLMKKRNIPIGGHHQSQADDTEVGPAFLAMTPLGKFGLVIETVYEGKKISTIKQEHIQIQFELRHALRNNLLFDLTDILFGNPIHIVPKSLADQLRGGQGHESAQNCFIIPVPQFNLAGGTDASVQSGYQEILANRRALRSLFGDMSVNNLNDV